MRLIDADKLAAHLERRIEYAPTIDPETLPIVRQLRAELEQVKAERDAAVRDLAADVTPVVHGRWVYGEDVDIQCSVCGADAFTEGDYRQVKSRYCPNCGAKMDLEG